MIKHAAFHTHGAAGPSGVDVFAWQHLCSSFGDASVGLCNALITTRYIVSASISANLRLGKYLFFLLPRGKIDNIDSVKLKTLRTSRNDLQCKFRNI